MPRRARQLIEGGIYHVYNRVASGEDIFANPETAVGFMEQLREVKDRETAELRQLVVALGVERWRQRCEDLAGVLGKSPNVVSYWVVDGVRRRREDPRFAERLDDLDGRLAKTT